MVKNKNLFSLFELSFGSSYEASVLFFAVLLMAFVDISSLALVIPALNFFIESQSSCDIGKNDLICYWYDYAEILIPSLFLLLLALKLTLLRKVTNMTFLMGSNLALNIVKSSFYVDLQKSQGISSSTYIGAVTSRVSTATIQTLLPLAQSVANGLVLLAIGGYALTQFPVILMSIIVPIILSYALYANWVRYYLNQRGITINESLSALTKTVAEMFKAQKELRVYGTAENLVQGFWKLDRTFRSAHADNVVFAQFPRYLIETLIILTLLVLISSGVLLNESGSAREADILGAAIIAFRLLPLGQYIFNSWTAVKANKAIIDELITLASSSMLTNRVPRHVVNEIGIDDGVILAPESGKILVEKVSFNLKRGEILYVMGASGSGKSTILDVLLGFRNLSAGRVKGDGKTLDMTREFWFEGFAYVPQKPLFFDDSLRKNITLGREGVSDEDIVKHLNGVGLGEKLQSLPLGLDSVLGEEGKFFSGGEAQRIGIVRALLGNPNFVLLDECTSALDQATESLVLKYLYSELNDSGVAFITHRPQLSYSNSRVLTLVNGSVVIT